MPHSITTMGNKRKKLIQTYTDSPIIQGTPVMRTITEWMTITERHMDNVKDTETVTSMNFTTVTIEPSTITITQTPVYSNEAYKCYVPDNSCRFTDVHNYSYRESYSTHGDHECIQH